MSMLSDLAGAFQSLADNLDAVDADSVVSESENAAATAAATGSADLVSAVERAKESAEVLREAISKLVDQAKEVASGLNAMT